MTGKYEARNDDVITSFNFFFCNIFLFHRPNGGLLPLWRDIKNHSFIPSFIISASCSNLCKSPTSILQKKACGKLYQVIPFPVVYSMDAEVKLIFPIQTSIKKKIFEGARPVLL